MKTLSLIDMSTACGGEGFDGCAAAALLAGFFGGTPAAATVNSFCNAAPGQPSGVGSYNSAGGEGPRGTQNLPSSESIDGEGEYDSWR